MLVGVQPCAQVVRVAYSNPIQAVGIYKAKRQANSGVYDWSDI